MRTVKTNFLFSFLLFLVWASSSRILSAGQFKKTDNSTIIKISTGKHLIQSNVSNSYETEDLDLVDDDNFDSFIKIISLVNTFILFLFVCNNTSRLDPKFRTW